MFFELISELNELLNEMVNIMMLPGFRFANPDYRIEK